MTWIPVTKKPVPRVIAEDVLIFVRWGDEVDGLVYLCSFMADGVPAIHLPPDTLDDSQEENYAWCAQLFSQVTHWMPVPKGPKS